MTSKCKSTRSVRPRAKKSKRPVELSRCVKPAELKEARLTMLHLKRNQRVQWRKVSRELRKRNHAPRQANDFGVLKYRQNTGTAPAHFVYAGRNCDCASGRRDHNTGRESGSFARMVSDLAQPAHRKTAPSFLSGSCRTSARQS